MSLAKPKPALSSQPGFFSFKKGEKMEKIEKCLNPGCGQEITVSFSRQEELASGKHIVCPNCNGLNWFPFLIGKPHFFPHAADQYGRPRQLRC